MSGSVRKISIALRTPTIWASVTVEPASGAIATRVAAERNFADSPAITRSAAHTRPSPPPPAATPWTSDHDGRVQTHERGRGGAQPRRWPRGCRPGAGRPGRRTRHVAAAAEVLALAGQQDRAGTRARRRRAGSRRQRAQQLDVHAVGGVRPVQAQVRDAVVEVEQDVAGIDQGLHGADPTGIIERCDRTWCMVVADARSTTGERWPPKS